MAADGAPRREASGEQAGAAASRGPSCVAVLTGCRSLTTTQVRIWQRALRGVLRILPASELESLADADVIVSNFEDADGVMRELSAQGKRPREDALFATSAWLARSARKGQALDMPAECVLSRKRPCARAAATADQAAPRVPECVRVLAWRVDGALAGEGGWASALARAARAQDALVVVLVRTRLRPSSEPAALGALCAALREATGRGWHALGSSREDGEAGTAVLSPLELSPVELSPACAPAAGTAGTAGTAEARHQQRRQQQLRAGRLQAVRVRVGTRAPVADAARAGGGAASAPLEGVDDLVVLAACAPTAPSAAEPSAAEAARRWADTACACVRHVRQAAGTHRQPLVLAGDVHGGVGGDGCAVARARAAPPTLAHALAALPSGHDLLDAHECTQPALARALGATCVHTRAPPGAAALRADEDGAARVGLPAWYTTVGGARLDGLLLSRTARCRLEGAWLATVARAPAAGAPGGAGPAEPSLASAHRALCASLRVRPRALLEGCRPLASSLAARLSYPCAPECVVNVGAHAAHRLLLRCWRGAQGEDARAAQPGGKSGVVGHALAYERRVANVCAVPFELRSREDVARALRPLPYAADEHDSSFALALGEMAERAAHAGRADDPTAERSCALLDAFRAHAETHVDGAGVARAIDGAHAVSSLQSVLYIGNSGVLSERGVELSAKRRAEEKAARGGGRRLDAAGLWERFRVDSVPALQLRVGLEPSPTALGRLGARERATVAALRAQPPSAAEAAEARGCLAPEALFGLLRYEELNEPIEGREVLEMREAICAALDAYVPPAAPAAERGGGKGGGERAGEGGDGGGGAAAGGWVVELVGGRRRGASARCHDADFLVTHPTLCSLARTADVVQHVVAHMTARGQLAPRELGPLGERPMCILHAGRTAPSAADARGGVDSDVGVRECELGAYARCEHVRAFRLHDSSRVGNIDHHAKFFGVFYTAERRRARRIDVVVCSPLEYPFALLGWTNGRCFNRHMRLHALEHGFSLNNHCLMTTDRHPVAPAGRLVPYEHAHGVGARGALADGQRVRTEEDIFRLLGLPFVPPHLRNA